MWHPPHKTREQLHEPVPSLTSALIDHHMQKRPRMIYWKMDEIYQKFFHTAFRQGLIPSNPFRHTPGLPMVGSRTADARSESGDSTTAGDVTLKMMISLILPMHAVHCKATKWAYLDSNQGPQLYQSCALAN